ncbi:CCT3 (YJL014W) [Zygosaccharomyces parabailii]|nr:CCT3 (YJL014W) [Zygosaccharomyces parabailii]
MVIVLNYMHHNKRNFSISKKKFIKGPIPLLPLLPRDRSRALEDHWNMQGPVQAPVVFMNTTQERTSGRQAQISNITAAKAVADVIRTCLGPKAMLKMLLDPMGGLVLTNDGHAILREIDVAHPAAKSMLELSRTQDEEVGDGTTTVIILAGEILSQCSLYLIEKNIHPVIIIQALKKALSDALEVIKMVSRPVDVENDTAMKKLIQASIGTKYVNHWSQKMCDLALDAVKTVRIDLGPVPEGEPAFEIDIKRYVRVEKIPGGDVMDSQVLRGVLLNKDVVHPKMSRLVKNPRVVLLDCPLEYKKGESQTNIEITKEEDWNRILQIEEEQVQAMCQQILAVKPTVVITEKGVSDLAQHFLLKGGCSVLRRVKKSDNNRISRVTGATIVTRVEDLKESDVGTKCGLFKVELIGDEYFTFLDESKDPKACTIMLRGGSKDILNEIERNLNDALAVTRNVMLAPSLSPGGGATEMAVSVKLAERAKQLEGIQQWPYQAVADAMECIARTLIQNAGGNPIRMLSQLRASHAQGQYTMGVDGESGKLVDMVSYGIWEPEVIKQQSIKTAIESACLLLRVDDIVSGVRKQE